MGHQAPVSQSRFKLSYRLEGCNFIKKNKNKTKKQRKMNIFLTHWSITGKQNGEKRNKTKLKRLLTITSNR